jgi:hypothetical protein
MLSRIFWISLAVIALVAGMAVQERSWLFSWGEDGAIDRSIESRIDRAVDRSVDGMEVIGSDGKEIAVPAETKRALAAAIRALVAAEAELALARVRDEGDSAVKAATARRDSARAEVERLKIEVERSERLAQSEEDVVRGQVQQKIRDDLRETVRDAVRN